MDTSGFHALESYFDSNFGTLSAIHCESTFHVRRHNPQNTDELMQMVHFLEAERKSGQKLLGEKEVSRYTDDQMTLVAVDMNDPEAGALGKIASYITVELFVSNDETKKFLYIGNSYTSIKYQRLGLSVLLRFFLIKLALELKDVLQLEGIGSFTIAPESQILMVNKLGFHKWQADDGRTNAKFKTIEHIMADYGNYVDTFLMLTSSEDVKRLKKVVHEQTELMGACMLNFQKKKPHVNCHYCDKVANYKSADKDEFFCGKSCQQSFYLNQ